MTIHLDVLPKPLSGYEDEFEQLIELLDSAQWAPPKTASSYIIIKSTGLFGWGKKKRVFDFEAANARLDEISEPCYTHLGAPIVGKDLEADEWLKKAFARKELDAKNETEALQKFKGLYALDVLPVCDGFPVYSASTWNKGYDRTIFYGPVFEACESLIGKELSEGIYGPLFASELAIWSKKLRSWADEFAKINNLEAILGDRNFKSDRDPDVSLHIVDQMARWSQFWSSKGHGSIPRFVFE